MPSLDRQLQEIIERETGESRYLDLCLCLRREKTGETLLWAGDVWDHQEKRFTRESTSPHIIDVEESQVPFTRWFAEWLKAYRDGLPRTVSLVLNEGDRRGGKTTISILCQIAALIDVPNHGNSRAIGWVVSETFKKRDEIEENISQWIPSSWYEHWKAPEFRYEFANGAVLRNLSAQDPEDMRQGRADILCFNEPQQMVAKAVVNGLYGTADKSGLTILACNPPTQVKGEWLVDLKEAIDNRDENAAGAVAFHFESRLNKKINQPARGRIGRLAGIISPSQVGADDLGVWARLGDRAYPKWNKKFAKTKPEIGDITEDVLRKTFSLRGFEYLAGADFQGYPYNSAVLWKIYPGPNGWIYWAVDEFMVDGAEIHMLEDIREAGYTESQVLFVGDASGQWQNYKHEEGLRSFAEMKKDGWVVKPPREPKADSKTQRTGNPAVESRLRVMIRLMEQERIFVDPDKCPNLIASYRECPLKKDGSRVKKHTRHAHLSDAADYPLYRVDPKPKAERAPLRTEAWSVPSARRNVDF